METEQQQPTVWEYLEQPNPPAPEAEALYRWGQNYEPENNPFVIYLDLIGWSDEYIGELQATRKSFHEYLDCVELDYLADALKEYANNPHDVRDWVVGLMESECV